MNDQPPKQKGSFEYFQMSVGIVVSVATVLIAFGTLMLNSEIGESNQKLATIEQQLGQTRFGFERLKDIYDRTEKYLSAEVQDTPRGNALAVLIRSLPDESLRDDLLLIIRTETKNPAVAARATEEKSVETASPEAAHAAMENGVVFSTGDPGRTDLGVFVCMHVTSSDETAKAAMTLGRALAESGKFGRITGAVWRDFDGVVPQPQTVTIILDKGHPESNEFEPLQQFTTTSLPELTVTRLDNPGSSSPWFISIVVCT